MGVLTGGSPAGADHLTEAQRYPNTDPIEVWSATITVASLTGSAKGCNNDDANGRCSNASVLTENDFVSYRSAYTVQQIATSFGTFVFIVEQAIPDSLYLHATLHVGETQLALSDGARSLSSSGDGAVQWTNPGFTWPAGDVVDLRITRPAWWFGTELFGGDLVTQTGFAPTLNIASDSGSGTFQVRLTQAPTANVTVNLRKSPISCAGCADVPPSDTNSASVSPAALTFTSSNYSTGQTVTVSGVADDDSDDEHFVLLAIVSAAATASENDRYRAPLSVAGVHVKVQENTSTQSLSLTPTETIIETNDIVIPQQSEPKETSPQQSASTQTIPAAKPPADTAPINPAAINSVPTDNATVNRAPAETNADNADNADDRDSGDNGETGTVLPAGIDEYDTNNNDQIDLNELLRAAQDYQNNEINRQQLLAIIRHYLNN